MSLVWPVKLRYMYFQMEFARDTFIGGRHRQCRVAAEAENLCFCVFFSSAAKRNQTRVKANVEREEALQCWLVISYRNCSVHYAQLKIAPEDCKMCMFCAVLVHIQWFTSPCCRKSHCAEWNFVVMTWNTFAVVQPNFVQPYVMRIGAFDTSFSLCKRIQFSTNLEFPSELVGTVRCVKVRMFSQQYAM